jgi:hypothetical protein
MRQRQTLLAFALFALIVFGGCAAPAANSPQTPSPSPSPTSNLPQGVPLPDAVQVVRTDPINPLPPLSRTIDTASAVQRLYRALYALYALPPFKSTFSCWADTGIDIHLTFLHQGTTILTARFHATGCAFVRFGSQPPQESRGPTDAFVTLLASTVGVSRQELIPPNGVCECW